MGRLLISLILCEQSMMRAPLPYFSLYFKTHRKLYYDLLNSTRLLGDWEAWLEFFAEGILAVSSMATANALELYAMSQNNKAKISRLGRSAGSALQIHQALIHQPVATAGWLSQKTGIALSTTNNALKNLEQLGIIGEITNHRRNRLFYYTQYIKLFNRGMEPPA